MSLSQLLLSAAVKLGSQSLLNLAMKSERLGVILKEGRAVMNVSELQNVRDAVYARFTPISDIEKHGVDENWPCMSDIPDSGPFSGDCDDFAVACQKELLKIGKESRLMLVSNSQGGHLICECDGYVLDNLQMWVKPWDQCGYTVHSIKTTSGKWRRIKNAK